MLVEMDTSRKKALADAQERTKAARVPNLSANLVQKWYKVVRSGTMQVITRWMELHSHLTRLSATRGTDQGSQKRSVPKRGLDRQRSAAHWV